MGLPAATQRLMAAVRDFTFEVAEFPEGTKTAADAAAAVGCDVAAIVKSLVFLADGDPVVCLIPGDLRLDPGRLATATGASKVARAPLELVKAVTGFAAGGTPPFGHANPVRVLADPGLRRHAVVWAAAGTPTTVFPITIEDLDRHARPRWVDLTGWSDAQGGSGGF